MPGIGAAVRPFGHFGGILGLLWVARATPAASLGGCGGTGGRPSRRLRRSTGAALALLWCCSTMLRSPKLSGLMLVSKSWDLGGGPNFGKASASGMFGRRGGTGRNRGGLLEGSFGGSMPAGKAQDGPNCFQDGPVGQAKLVQPMSLLCLPGRPKMAHNASKMAHNASKMA